MELEFHHLVEKRLREKVDDGAYCLQIAVTGDHWGTWLQAEAGLYDHVMLPL